MLLPLFVLAILTVVLVMAYQNTKKKDTTTKIFLVLSYLVALGICVKYGLIKNSNLLEGFEVEIPDIDEDNNVEQEMNNDLDDETDEQEMNNDLDDETDEQEMNNDLDDETIQPTKKKYKSVTLDDLKKIENQKSPLDNLSKQTKFTKSNSRKTTTTKADKYNKNKNNKKQNNFKEGFNNIVQKDTNGTSNVFRPQIVINTNDKTLTHNLEDNSESMSNIPFNKNHRNKFLSPKKNNLFKNNSIISEDEPHLVYNVNQEQKSDAFTWLNDTMARNQNGADESKFYSTKNTLSNNYAKSALNISKNESFTDQSSKQCGTFKPYAVETGTDPVYIDYDKKTLSNKSYVPGMQYMPPTTWHVPQPHTHTNCRNVCNSGMIDTRNLPIAMMDHGTPVNALEVGYDGTIAKTEEEVRHTNVGSILPKFEYKEYIDCYENPYSRPRTNNPLTTNPLTTNPLITNPLTTNPLTTNPQTTSGSMLD